MTVLSQADDWASHTGQTNVDEPRAVEISYMLDDIAQDSDSRLAVTEVVYEDPEEADQRPRLLVPMKSVLAMKSLCEREFIRIEAVTDMLNRCRLAYYKELLWLREQLTLATQPDRQLMMAAVQNYEVYWFDPPNYVDPELKEFMLNCNRMTNKALIEENYVLSAKLQGQDNDIFQNLEFATKSMLKKHSVAKIFKRLYSNAKEAGNVPGNLTGQNTAQNLEELEAAVIEAFPKLRQRPTNNDLDFEKLIEKLQADLKASKAEAAKEKARADAEAQRAAELERRPPIIQKEVDTAVQHEADIWADRIRERCLEFARMHKLQLGALEPTGNSLLPLLEQAFGIMDAIFRQTVPAVEPEDTKPTNTNELDLKQQLRRAQEAERAAMEKIRKLERQLAEATAKVEEVLSRRSSKETSESSEEITRLKDALEQARRDAAKLAADLEDRRKREAASAQRIADLLAQLRAAEEEVEQLSSKLARAQEKLKELKSELKEMKRKAGIAVESSDEEDEDDFDGPDFLLRYYLRAKNSTKPRWMLLSEDAKHKAKKQQYFFAQKFHSVQPLAGTAFEFLRSPSHHRKNPGSSHFQHDSGSLPDIPMDSGNYGFSTGGTMVSYPSGLGFHNSNKVHSLTGLSTGAGVLPTTEDRCMKTSVNTFTRSMSAGRLGTAADVSIQGLREHALELSGEYPQTPSQHARSSTQIGQLQRSRLPGNRPVSSVSNNHLASMSELQMLAKSSSAARIMNESMGSIASMRPSIRRLLSADLDALPSPTGNEFPSLQHLRAKGSSRSPSPNRHYPPATIGFEDLGPTSPANSLMSISATSQRMAMALSGSLPSKKTDKLDRSDSQCSTRVGENGLISTTSTPAKSLTPSANVRGTPKVRHTFQHTSVQEPKSPLFLPEGSKSLAGATSFQRMSPVSNRLLRAAPSTGAATSLSDWKGRNSEDTIAQIVGVTENKGCTEHSANTAASDTEGQSPAVLFWGIGHRSGISFPLTNQPAASRLKEVSFQKPQTSPACSDRETNFVIATPDALPRLPPGKVHKSPAMPSWFFQV
jgi:hypothetical protein